MNQERRTIARCPLCSGPALHSEEFPEKIKCRNSACLHNHQNINCPRCKSDSLASVIWQANQWHYVCKDCENKWSKS